MTFANINGFFMDVSGIAGDLLYGLSDNFYDPCSIRVTVGVGESVPVVIRAAAGVGVGVGQGIDQSQISAINTVEISAQNITVSVPQPGGASNPNRQIQPQNVGQSQLISVVAAGGGVLAEFARGSERAGVVLLAPKNVNAVVANNTIRELGKQIAVEASASQATGALLSQSDDFVVRSLANQLRSNQANLQSVLQKSGASFDEINAIKNAMFNPNNDELVRVVQALGDKIPNLTRSLQTQSANIAVKACA